MPSVASEIFSPPRAAVSGPRTPASQEPAASSSEHGRFAEYIDDEPVRDPEPASRTKPAAASQSDRRDDTTAVRDTRSNDDTAKTTDTAPAAGQTTPSAAGKAEAATPDAAAPNATPEAIAPAFPGIIPLIAEADVAAAGIPVPVAQTGDTGVEPATTDEAAAKVETVALPDAATQTLIAPVVAAPVVAPAPVADAATAPAPVDASPSDPATVPVNATPETAPALPAPAAAEAANAIPALQAAPAPASAATDSGDADAQPKPTNVATAPAQTQQAPQLAQPKPSADHTPDSVEAEVPPADDAEAAQQPRHARPEFNGGVSGQPKPTPDPRKPAKAADIATDPAARASDVSAALKAGSELVQNLGLTAPAAHNGVTAVQSSAAATAAAAAAPMAAPTTPVPIAGVAIEIAAQALSGKNRFEIRLDPPELGRIDVRLEIDNEGHVKSRLIVERAETLDMLRRDAPQLERTLQQAGLKTADNALEFSLRQHMPQRDGDDFPRNTANLIAPDDGAPTLESVRQHYGRMLGLGGGLDIRV